MRKKLVRRYVVISLLLASAFAAIYMPLPAPSYLSGLKPVEHGFGWAVYRTNDATGEVQRQLLKDAESSRWTEAGAITYVDHRCNNYVSNRFLEIEWGWPPENKDDLYVEVKRRSLLQGLFHR